MTRARETPFDLDSLAPLAASLAGVGYWRFDTANRQFAWSEQMYRIYGLDPAAGPPSLDAVFDYCHPDDREKLVAHQQEQSGKGRDTEIDVRIVRSDGEVRHVVSRSSVQLDVQGGTLARFGTLTDITDIKRAEAAANASEQRYRFLAEYAPDMISRTKAGGEIVYVSPSSVRVLGYTPEEMRFLNPTDMVHPEDFEWVIAAFTRLIEQRLERLEEPLCYRARHKDGHWIWIEANPIQIFSDDGATAEFIDIVRDVTQTKEFEAELEEARRQAVGAAAAKAAFLANMSHELRTPLTSIIGFSRLLSDRPELTDEARHFAERTSEASEALLAIINDVLDFSKLEAGHVSLELRPMSVRRLVEETTGLIALQAKAKGVELAMSLDPTTPEFVTGDMARLRQVLLNLLSNALKFTEQGSVTVRTDYRTGGEEPLLRLTVTDTGAGIAPEKIAVLFERFSQADVSINRTHGGTGLGLAISKGIVELMGGVMGVDSREGQGSSFWLEIPAASAVAAVAAAAPDQAEMAQGGLPLRILMVDDTAVNRELVKLMLGPLGVEVHEADGGQAGVEAAAVTRFDLILMDVRMPGVDGLEATRAIRADCPNNRLTPILALTADVQPENAAACRAAGMDDVLPKPIVPAQLLAKISEWGTAADEASPTRARA